MASRLENISQLFSNFRTRSIIIVTLAILGLAILVGIIRLVNAPKQSNAANTNLANAPSQQTVPGLNQTSPEYENLQKELNQQRIQQAEQSGGSAIPTLTYQNDVSTQQPTPTDTTTTPSPDNTSAPVDPQIAALQAQVAEQAQQIQQANAAQIQQTTDDKSNAMRAQAQQLLQAWTQSPNQIYIGGNEEQNAAAAAAAAATATSAAAIQQSLPPLIKAGDLQFAVLNTEINSDEPGPVMATIVLGPYKGAKLLGSLQTTKSLPGTNGAEAVMIQFNVMSLADVNHTIGVSAVAIDPNTARTALASDVDHHYLLRYGSLFASSFLEGYGNAALQAGSSVTQNQDGGTFTTYPDASPKRETASAFGQVGQNWGQQLGDTFNRPNTITVHAGTGLGVLYLSDVASPNAPPASLSQAVSTKIAQDQTAANNVSTSNVLPVDQAQNQLIQPVASIIQNGQ